jgi:hypothetical protein
MIFMNNTSNDNNHPFGSPDGSRAELDELLIGFVDFNDESVWGGLAIKSSDSTARVLVGRKGSGKTLYLRRLQAFAAKDDSKYATQIEQSLPSTEDIIKFCHWFDREVLTEKWMSLWEKAILATVAQNILHDRMLRPYLESVDKELKKQLSGDYFKTLLPDSSIKTTCYEELKNMIQAHSSAIHINTLLNDPKWRQLESVIKDIVPTCPPIYLYIDAIDEEFSHAPMYWLRCQKGLFYQTMRFLRDKALGGRLHVTICIRDLVLTSVYRSEHKNRYKEEPHIIVLIPFLIL